MAGLVLGLLREGWRGEMVKLGVRGKGEGIKGGIGVGARMGRQV